MRVKKAIKRIAALGVGATMVGATLMGAAAADLSEYPGMFIENGMFDGILVVGEKAAGIDTLGMTNIALGLQKEAVTKTVVCSSASAGSTSVSDGVKIDKSSTHMNYGNSIADVESTLDDNDLPAVLEDGEYTESRGDTDNEESYTQKLEFTDDTGTVVFFQDRDAPDAGSYLFFDDAKATPAYTFTLEFDNNIEFDTTNFADDVEGSTLEMQGKVYTITDISTDGSDIIDELTMMSGESEPVWIGQGTTIIKTIDGVDHTVEMKDVTTSEDKCGLIVDGSEIWVDVGSTEKISGVTVGVTDANAINSKDDDEDICEVYVGASEVVLKEGNEIEVAGTDVDGSDVTLDLNSQAVAGEWPGLQITWTPDEEYFLAPGEELVDPVFGNFKFVFGGVEDLTEDIALNVGGNDGTFEFVNSDGKDVEIPLYSDETNVWFGTGDDVSEMLYYQGNNVCTASPVTDCEGSQWLFVVSDEAHIVEITDIDTNNLEISFKDVTYDTTDTDEDYTNAAGYDEIYLSEIGDVRVNVQSGSVTIHNTDLGDPTDIETEYGARITDFTGASNTDNVTIAVGENQDSSLPSADEATVTLVVEYDSGQDDTLEILTPSITANDYFGCQTSPTTAGGSGCDLSEDDNDNQRWMTKYGSELQYDSEDKDEFLMLHAEDWVEGDVFVAPTEAMLSSSSGSDADGCQTVETLNPIPSTANKLDSEVMSTYSSNNIISIGGPCANAVSSALLGNPEVCYAGFEEGKALIKLVEQDNNVAIVVAGGTGKDTKLASTILQNYEDYSDDLKGKELEAVTASENSITLGPVTAAAEPEAESDMTETEETEA